MKHKHFQRIALTGRMKRPQIVQTACEITKFLQKHDFSLYIHPDLLPHLNHSFSPLNDEGYKECDLILVVGGDGSILDASQFAMQYKKPILGINRGQLGFLADIPPTNTELLLNVLYGEYITNIRHALKLTLPHADGPHQATQYALNDIVISPGSSAKMMHFEIHMDNQFICHQKADGLVISTPTGSTAYALSAGGPILHPHLDVMVMVPMFPHKLSSRPLVVHLESKLQIKLSSHSHSTPHISCDGRATQELPVPSTLQITKSECSVQLIQPVHYNYFHTLREKLGWERNEM